MQRGDAPSTRHCLLSTPENQKPDLAADDVEVDDSATVDFASADPAARESSPEPSGPLREETASDEPDSDSSEHLCESASSDAASAEIDNDQVLDLTPEQASKLAKCQELIEYEFDDQALLLSALTHASGASHRLASNERLEFLGDAVLGLTVCHWLFEDYPHYSEGDLTKIKSAVVSRRACGKIACEIGLDQCLIVGRGVTRNRSFPRSLVSDVFESIIAALFIDGGADLVRDRLKRWLGREVDHAVQSQGSGNYKSALQQRAQRDLSCTPVYRLIRESGPDHRKAFLISAVIDDRQFTAAWGDNKKEAEQRAAANALAEMDDDPLPFPVEPKDPPEPKSGG